MGKHRKMTVAQVVDALGGTREVAELFQTSVRCVYNWRQNTLPANTYVPIKELLRKRGTDAPDTLWSMKQLPNGKEGKKSK